jgi:hypothetical protein
MFLNILSIKYTRIIFIILKMENLQLYEFKNISLIYVIYYKYLLIIFTTIINTISIFILQIILYLSYTIKQMLYAINIVITLYKVNTNILIYMLIILKYFILLLIKKYFGHKKYRNTLLYYIQ